MIKPTIKISKSDKTSNWRATLIWKGVGKDVLNGQFIWEHSDKSVLDRFKMAVEDGSIFENPKVITSGGFYCEETGDWIEEFQRVTFETVPNILHTISSKYMEKILFDLGYYSNKLNKSLD